MQVSFWAVFLGSCVVLTPQMRAQTNATFGQVIALGGTPADMVVDESRQQVYLVNSTAGRVDVYNYVTNTVAGSINVGTRPLGAAMTADYSTLYVANHDSSTLSVIALSSGGLGATLGTVTQTVTLPAKPQGVETELTGRAVICTDGSGAGSASNTLLVFDPTLPTGSQLTAVTFPPNPATPPSITALTARPSTTINGRLMRTPDGNHIIGVTNITNNTATIAYIYEPASTTVLQSRIITGSSSTMAISPDSTSFMAGFTKYDLATLNVLGVQNIANAPFSLTTAFAATNNLGGAAYSPDGKTLYSAFNTAALTTPPPAPSSSTLMISDPSSLAIRLGINLPESIVGKIYVTSAGTDAFAISTSGITHLPLSTLYTYPILMPSITTVFLAEDDCHQGVVSQAVQINNIGGGKLTFAVPTTIPSGAAALVVSATSGLAPSTVNFTMDPGRSGIVRVPGTNLYSGGGASNSGAAVNLQLASPNAINVPPVIRVFMNYRDATQRGLIYPIQTLPNSVATSGLYDIVFDSVRNLMYISNAGMNRIEVFDTVAQQLLSPIPVGQLPHEMALGLDGNTLYVAETGGETIDMVDLTAQQVIGRVVAPPIPRAANTAVVTVTNQAIGLSGLQYVASNGNLWEVVAGTAVPRQGTFVTGVNATTGAQTAITAPQYMMGAADGSKILLLGGNETAYLYDGLTDTYTSENPLFSGTVTGYYGPLAIAPNNTYMLANGMVLNSSLSVIGGAATPGSTPVTPPAQPGQPSNPVAQSPLRNVAAVAPLDQTYFVRMTTPVRSSVTATITDDAHTTLEKVNTLTGVTQIVAEMPENPITSLFGSARTNVPPRQMAVDAAGNVYALTLSGLSVVPIATTSAATLPAAAATRPVTNATTGTTSFSPGGFIAINGTNLASTASATSLPAPTVLGGSCVLFDGTAIPLLSTSPTQIVGQLPATIRPGANVMQIRSLNNAQRSNPVAVTVGN